MLVNKKICTGCGACRSSCNKNAITMECHKDGFYYPEIDSSLCNKCGICEKACPVIDIKSTNEEKTVYAVKNKDISVRLSSSSGGAFNSFAEKVISEGGVCFGAGFDSDFSVKHIACYTGNDIIALRGSKYVQSDLGEVYKEVKSELLSGKFVLFSGTPCQVAGLKKYLKKDYEKLFTVDFICHGVPSPTLWKSYLEYNQKKEKSDLCRVFFRDKTNGWRNFSMMLGYKNGNKKVIMGKDDMYIRAFLLNIFLRPSCYACKFKDKNYQSDVTLADFWGIDNFMPEINDDKGVSLVILNTDKGRQQFEIVKKEFDECELSFYDAISKNVSYKKSCETTMLNKFAICDSVKLSFDKLYNKYCLNSFSQRVIRKLARVCSKNKT